MSWGGALEYLSELVFRRITRADFFHINKQPGTDTTGGGQSYIDFPVNDVAINTWRDFFASIMPEEKSNGPLWTVEIKSLGGLGSQKVDIGQRRPASVNIRAQKMFSLRSNRVFAWHPDHGDFPLAPTDIESADDPRIPALIKGLIIFILKTDQDEYWAGWSRAKKIKGLIAADARFKKMLVGQAGHLSFDPTVALDISDLKDPFRVQPHADPEESVAAELFQEDILSKEVEKTQKVTEVFQRNLKVARKLKLLYGTCQVTGDAYVFQKTNGDPYLEVHHLVPLGKGGSDKLENLVVISAHVHRMLHHADVKGIDLMNIVDDKLDFTINGEAYTITWLPEHAKMIVDAGDATV